MDCPALDGSPVLLGSLRMIMGSPIIGLSDKVSLSIGNLMYHSETFLSILALSGAERFCFGSSVGWVGCVSESRAVSGAFRADDTGSGCVTGCLHRVCVAGVIRSSTGWFFAVLLDSRNSRAELSEIVIVPTSWASNHETITSSPRSLVTRQSICFFLLPKAPMI